ncbi:hypothetical protein FHR83_006637 [Actinoplanes campanulatus]|uniref:Uncharacterized protein n=1 Tax=Actinoplanes campanulatus TaxID=113559 RepID=A0A7W5AMQ2_9ACTN|nr:hypothetical protein [Actinoplanes campanulatus]MBB3098931.1 hypothetical protein [Actinoplanes campanulatus]
MSVWRFVDGGAVRHLIDEDDATTAVCGHTPWAGWEWLGAAAADAGELGKRRDCLACVRMAGCPHVACRTTARRPELPWSWGEAA